MSSSRTSLLLLKKCKCMHDLKKAHARIITEGLGHDYYALSRIIALCADPNNGSLTYAQTIFYQTENPTLCIRNTMLKALLLKRDHFELMELYRRMLDDGVHPDHYTFPYVLKACSAMQDCRAGSEVHVHVLKLGFGFDALVGSTVILMYASCGEIGIARKVFDEMPHRVAACWTVMISGYSKIGKIEEARALFDGAPVKDRGVWGAMISGYVQSNGFKEALLMFRQMQVGGFEPDEGVLVSVLCACAHVGGLELGTWIHNYVHWIGLPVSVRLGTALVDMYVKCGNLVMAKKVFDRISNKDTVCWNVMIFGLAIHGDGDGALALFVNMEKEGCRPDDATFIAILSACGHSGLVKEGLEMFDIMRTLYKIEPRAEHYGCVVDFLSRAGQFEQAMELIARMPGLASPSEKAIAWRALLSACWSHGKIELAEIAAEHLMQLEVHSGVYVLLSNVYEECGRHCDARRIRKSMKHRGIPKTPGCSSIEIGGRVHEFVAGEQMHLQIEEIFEVVDNLNDQLVSAG
ncbi:pentatricopeptide repeat-containing protein At5g56310-like [Dioscorea cayenensis subsp. rotundata]|uniref:Pentatricopeptide repeat-containing protein At5g56310-like n=1 Tax=Dioscorea cayennensis subsp. rotundata TaxID=55577 RepID=A0AB40CK38_DIOCR|nr:pentatricopeptide repeat-containing protein At5g56310-like [Dioscorea cayenensis subsp. rotundata]